MDASNVTVGLALLAGLASFLSPCVLALVPAYVGYLGSRTVRPDGTVVENRGLTFAHGLAFVLGFSFVFVLLGVAAAALGLARFFKGATEKLIVQQDAVRDLEAVIESTGGTAGFTSKQLQASPRRD